MAAQTFLGSPNAPAPARINTASSGVTAIAAAAAGKSHRVYGLRLSVAGAVIVQVRSGTTVLEQFNFSGNGGGMVFDLRELPYYTTVPGEALNLNLSAAVQVDGVIEFATGV